MIWQSENLQVLVLVNFAGEGNFGSLINHSFFNAKPHICNSKKVFIVLNL